MAKLPSTRKSTIYDIADRAGTSTATVSRVLANNGYPVSAELRRRILDAAEALNYSPNAVGRMLKKSDSTDLGIILPTISNPYYSMLLLGAEQEARKEGFNLFLCNSLRDAEAECNYLESLFQKQVRGIMISTVNDNLEYLKELQGYGVTIVTFDQDVKSLKCSKVGFDYALGARMAVDHLIANGHRDIAFLSAPVTRKSRSDMLSGFKLAMAEHGLDFSARNIVIAESETELQDGTYEFQNGKALAARFLELSPRPTAIFTINDLTAFGVMQELLLAGVRVPEDVSIVGFDNIELAAMVNPPLTTINQPAFETGRLACQMLLESLNGQQSEDISVVLQPLLVKRGSVARIFNR